MKAIIEAIRRAFTLPKRFNSVKDILKEPIDALDEAIERLEWIQVVLKDNEDVSARLRTIIGMLQKVKELIKRYAV